MKRTVLAILAAMMFMTSTASAADIYVNGVRVTDEFNWNCTDCTVEFAADGSIRVSTEGPAPKSTQGPSDQQAPKTSATTPASLGKSAIAMTWTSK